MCYVPFFSSEMCYVPFFYVPFFCLVLDFEGAVQAEGG